MKFFLFSAIYLLSTMAFASGPDVDYADYQTLSYIPEPMIFDLVRPLGSKKGQWEINMLLTQEHAPELSKSHESPEIEYVIFDDVAVEFELPSVGGEPDAIKGAFQWTIGNTGKNNQAIHGIQILGQKYINKNPFTDLTPLYIFGYRFNREYTLLTMVGDQYRSGSGKNEHFLVLNTTIFDVYSHVKEIEFGLEQNLLGIGENFQYWRITPQIDIVLEDHWKIQTGFGAIYSYKVGWESTSSFRAVKEFY